MIRCGTSLVEAAWRIAVYTVKILKGTKPADLSVGVHTQQRLILNLKTAQEIGVTLLLRWADQVV